MRFSWSLLVLSLAFLLAGCDAQEEYSDFRANFVFQQSLSVPQLQAALGGSPGTFCTIRNSGNNYIFECNDVAGTFTYTKTAVDQRLTPIFIAGIIVGTPVLDQQLTAYDLACPNCNRNYITRQLQFSDERTTLVCPRCKCKYSLQTQQGLLVEGNTSAVMLIRYKATYDGMNNLYVHNP